GKVTDASGTADARRRAMVFLRSRDYAGGAGNNRPTPLDPNGSFEFRNVAPGSYEIIATIPGRGTAASGKASIDVGHNSIDDVRVTTNPPVSVTGRVRIDGQVQQQTSSVKLQVTLRPREAGGMFFGGNLNAKVADDGAFTLASVNQDRYT